MIAGSDGIVFKKILTPQLYPIYLLCVLYFYTTKYLHGVVNSLSPYKVLVQRCSDIQVRFLDRRQSS